MQQSYPVEQLKALVPKSVMPAYRSVSIQLLSSATKPASWGPRSWPGGWQRPAPVILLKGKLNYGKGPAPHSAGPVLFCQNQPVRDRYSYKSGKKEKKTGGCANIHLEEEKLFLLLERSGGKEILPDQERKIMDIFRQLLKESLEENQKKDLEKYEQLEKKIKYQQQLLLDKYLEGLVEESLYQIKERELQNKLKNNTGSRTCRQKNRDFWQRNRKKWKKASGDRAVFKRTSCDSKGPRIM